MQIEAIIHADLSAVFFICWYLDVNWIFLGLADGFRWGEGVGCCGLRLGFVEKDLNC